MRTQLAILAATATLVLGATPHACAAEWLVVSSSQAPPDLHAAIGRLGGTVVRDTNFGKRVVYLSAPGGQFTPGPDGTVIPTLPPDLQCDLGFGLGELQCFMFDGILNTSFFNPSRPSFYRFGFGTSFAAPHVAGVAALVIGKHGGSMSPGQVQAVLRRSADDLGEPGRDASFGWGRVNAERAVEMTR